MDHVLFSKSPITNFGIFCHADILNKEGVIRVVHDSDTAAKIEVTTVNENFYKLINFNFGTGNSGKRNDWQRFKSRITGFNGYNTGQILTHDELRLGADQQRPY